MPSVTRGIRESAVTVDGSRQIFMSEKSAGGSEIPVLFLNSLAADLTMWNDVRGRLGARTVAFDARGHGRSDVVPGEADLDGFADDAVAVMDATGMDRAVLCGLSLGGLTAMSLAGRMPDRVLGLVLANTAVSFPPAQMWRERADMARNGSFPQLVQPTLERWLTPGFREAQPTIAAQVRRMIASTPAEGYAAACAVLERGDARKALAAFSGPVLAIAGQHDQSTPVARAEEIVGIAQSGELLALDAAHLTAVERAEEFAVALQGFLERVGRDG